MVGVSGRGRVQRTGATAQLQENQLETSRYLRRQRMRVLSHGAPPSCKHIWLVTWFPVCAVEHKSSSPSGPRGGAWLL